MDFNIVDRELARFFIHTCYIQDKSSSEVLPGGEENEVWTTRQSDGEDIEYVCRREEVDTMAPFTIVSKRNEIGLGIQRKLIRLYLEGDVSIVSNLRIRNINGDGKVYEIESDFDLIADIGSEVADTQELVLQEVLDA